MRHQAEGWRADASWFRDGSRAVAILLVAAALVWTVAACGSSAVERPNAEAASDSGESNAGGDNAGGDKAGGDKAGGDKAGGDKAGGDKAGGGNAGGGSSVPTAGGGSAGGFGEPAPDAEPPPDPEVPPGPPLDTDECPVDARALAESGQWNEARDALRCILDDPAAVPPDTLAGAQELDQVAADALADGD
jgi:hypothetical protein